MADLFNNERSETDTAVERRRGPSAGTISRIVILTIVLLLSAAAILYGLFLLKHLLFLIVISVFFAYLIDPLVKGLRKPFKAAGKEKYMPRVLAILISYTVVFSVVGFAITAVAPSVAEQARALSANIPSYTASMQRSYEDLTKRFNRLRLPDEVQKNVTEKLTTMGTDIAGEMTSFLGTTAISVLTILPWFVLVPVLAFFFLKDVNLVRLGVLRMFPAGPYRARVEAMMADINLTLAAYTRAQLISCVMIGIICSLGFYTIGLKYALLLGILAGIFEFVPVLGPATIGIVVVVVAAFGEYPTKAWYVAIFLIALRICQDYVIYPRIVRGGIHLHPLMIILAVLAGEQIGGIPGVFISIPIVAIGSVVYRHILEHRGSRSVMSLWIEEPKLVESLNVEMRASNVRFSEVSDEQEVE
ncbi:MAG TPA: AI-2E family transporter [Pyrinomonadaceae bacterium]|nr:AI-2E family transporter [Pyrinomonadaceae bacterium]